MYSIHEIVGDKSLPNNHDDARILIEHEEAGHDLADVIYISLGETWNSALGIRDALTRVPAHSHGYVLTPYGLPMLHRPLRSYITRTHDLEPVAVAGEDYEVAVCQGGTRSAMFDFGRLLIDEMPAGQPIAVCASLGWDYTGVFAPLGYEMRYFDLTPEDRYQPAGREVEEALRQARDVTAGPILVVINPQHNPTGANWNPESVRHIIRAAVDSGAGILLDDAYFAIHNPQTTPTCALRILLQELDTLPRNHRPRWLAVRSLGKQFQCSGWGIGAMTAAPDTTAALVTRLFPQRGYVSSVPLQAAMAAWLADPASDQYLARQRYEYAAKRAAVAECLEKTLGYPTDAYFTGECTGYMLMQIPPQWQSVSSRDYRRECLRRGGVLLGDAHMATPDRSVESHIGHARIFLGPPIETLVTAIDRLSDAGLIWSSSPRW